LTGIARANSGTARSANPNPVMACTAAATATMPNVAINVAATPYSVGRIL
jgi:hypothetical protein